jgi:hypothetical protein
MRGREKEKARPEYVERAAGLKIDQFKNATSPVCGDYSSSRHRAQPEKTVP